MTQTVRGQPQLGLADTSLFIAMEQDRPLHGDPPERIAISVVTIGELRWASSLRRMGPHAPSASRP